MAQTPGDNGASTTRVPGANRWRHLATPRLFRMAYDRPRACVCGTCICLTADERAYQRRVFRIARAWSRTAAKSATSAKLRSSTS